MTSRGKQTIRKEGQQEKGGERQVRQGEESKGGNEGRNVRETPVRNKLQHDSCCTIDEQRLPTVLCDRLSHTVLHPNSFGFVETESPAGIRLLGLLWENTRPERRVGDASARDSQESPLTRFKHQVFSRNFSRRLCPRINEHETNVLSQMIRFQLLYSKLTNTKSHGMRHACSHVSRATKEWDECRNCDPVPTKHLGCVSWTSRHTSCQKRSLTD